MVAKDKLPPFIAGLRGWTVDLNIVTAGILGGVAGGLVAGGLARLAMRGVALIAGQTPEFNLLATVAILLLFGIAGLLLALLYLAVRPLIPVPTGWKILAYGALLAGLTAWPFLRTSDGELGIVTPWIGIALFAPIPLVYSLVLDIALRANTGLARMMQPVSGWWLAGFALSLIFSLGRMFAGLDSNPRTPAAIQSLYMALGLAPGDVREANGLVGFLFAILYSGLCATLLCCAYRRPAGAATAIGLLLILPAGVLGSLGRADSPGTLLEWLFWGLTVFVFAGSLWLVRRFALLSHTRIQPQTLLWLARAVGLASGAFLLMWAAILLIPGLQLRRLTAVHTGLAVPLFWWPWLLAPATLVYAVRRHGLWNR